MRQVMDEAGESVALVMDDTGNVVGLLTRASVTEALSAANAITRIPVSGV